MLAYHDIYLFGPFRLDPGAGILSYGSEPTMLGRRAVRCSALLDRAGAPVLKNVLVEAAWGGLAVADNNLTVQITALRRVLGLSAGRRKLDRNAAPARLSLHRTRGRAQRPNRVREMARRSRYPKKHLLRCCPLRT